MSSKVTFDYSKAMTFIKEHEIDSMKEIVGNAKDVLVSGTGAGNDYIGWVNLPVDYDKEEFARIQKAAEKIQSDSEVLIVIGIGGSYLGARAAIEFLRRFRPNELVRSGSRGEFQLREHDSFKINEETSFWHWKSRDVGGKTALDYLVKVEGIKFVDAVLALCEESPGYIPPSSQPEQKKEFALPPAAENNRRVFAYLMKRGISRKVIEACVRAGILYESADYHNAVFVGKDECGTARYAFLRGTYTKGKPFKAEVPGSEKAYCFCLPPKGKTNRLAVYEAAIETLAHLTMEGTSDKWRLSLGGIYAPKEGEETQSFSFKKPPALETFLNRHPEIEEIEICTNNDFAGRWAAEHLAKAYQGKYRMVRNLPEKEGCDYADLAKEKQEEQAARQRAVYSL